MFATKRPQQCQKPGALTTRQSGFGDSTTCSATVPRETRPAQPGALPFQKLGNEDTIQQAFRLPITGVRLSWFPLYKTELAGAETGREQCHTYRPSPRRWLRSKVASARGRLPPVPAGLTSGGNRQKGSGMSPLLSRFSPSERIPLVGTARHDADPSDHAAWL